MPDKLTALVLLLLVPVAFTVLMVTRLSKFKTKPPRTDIPYGSFPKTYHAHPVAAGIMYFCGGSFLLFAMTNILIAWVPQLLPASWDDGSIHHSWSATFISLLFVPPGLFAILWIRKIRIVLYDDAVERILWRRERLEKKDILFYEWAFQMGCLLYPNGMRQPLLIPEEMDIDGDFRRWLSAIPDRKTYQAQARKEGRII